MEYYYQGQLRLQLFGGSPNVTATVLLFAFFLVLGGVAFARQRIPGKRWLWAGVPGYLLCLLLLEGLLLTYSRGGMVALAVGLLVLVWKEWRLLLPLLAPALLLLSFTPSGLNRVKAVGDLQDRSVDNRLVLWYHGSGMVLDHWQKGVEGEACGVHYTMWYKPLSQRVEGYRGMVNGYLTYMGNHGLPAAFLVFWGLFFLACCAWDLGFLRGMPFYRCLGAGWISMAASEVFSTMYVEPAMLWCLGLAGMLSLGGFLWCHREAFRRNPGTGRTLAKAGGLLAGAAAALALLPVLCVVVIGCLARKDQYYHREPATLVLGEGTLACQRFTPRRPNGKWILHLAGNVTEEARDRILPLCEMGYGVLAVEGAGKWSFPETARRLPLLLRTPGENENPPFSLLMVSGGLPANCAFQYFCDNAPEEISCLVLWEPICRHPMEEYALESRDIPEGRHVLFLGEEEGEFNLAQSYLETQKEGRGVLVPSWEELPQMLEDLARGETPEGKTP